MTTRPVDHGPAVEPATSEASEIALRRILWACDFSSCAVGALRFVTPIAQAYGSEITAVHVIPTSLPPNAGAAGLTNPALLRPTLHHDVSSALDKYVRGAAEASVPTQVAIREGKPGAEILALAAKSAADLIVVGTHGEGAITLAVLGSVTEYILERAKCPVLAVPAVALPASGPLNLKTILWPTDFSPHADEALRFALSIAKRSRARLLLLHVVAGTVPGSGDERVRSARQRLQVVHDTVRAGGGEAEVIVVGGGNSAEILFTARERQADLIVMGTQGTRFFHSIFFGSTAQHVVRSTPCPVLAVRRA